MLFLTSKKSARWLVLFSHALFFITVLGLLATGLRIAVANEPKLVWFSMLLPEGNVHSWHFRFAFVFAVAFLTYGLALVLRKRLPLRAANHLATQWFYWSHYVGIMALIISLLSGLCLYFELPSGSVETVLTIHLVNSFVFIFYIVAHLLLALASRGLLKTLLVFNVVKNAPLASLLWVMILGVSVFLLNNVLSIEQTLNVAKTTESIELDGDAREAVWQNITPLTIQTYQGYQQPSKGTEVTVRAAHDEEFIYLLVRWKDATRSQVHLPLQKTPEGWTVLQTNAFAADENNLYEDKFAVMLSQSNALGGANSIHLGESPVAGQPSPPNKRGLHFTTDGSITDVWHWKSVRTGLPLQQVDDNFFGPPSPSDSEYKRYTGGYQKDKDDCEHLVRWDGSDYQTKAECGGFVMNWKLFETGIVTPIRLPKSADQLKRLGQFDLDPGTSDFGSWWLDWNDTVAYHPDADTFEVGTIIPSVLSLGPFTQGRGDVAAAGNWRDGIWQLELKRKLKTTSKYDLPIDNETYIWFAAFDHSQTRHSYHIRPIRIQLQ